MPVYNSKKYVDEAIKSCLNQTYSNYELIAVDDGSTDGTSEILKSYSDHLTLITQKNKGISAALNDGINAMKGNWFKVMNSDDILYPDCIELLISELNKINDKKVIVHGNCYVIDSNGEMVREWNQPNISNMNQFEQNVFLLDHNTVVNVTSIFHKDVFSKHGLFDESLRAGVDYELWLRLCLQHGYRLHLLEKKLIKYRRHKESITVNSMNKTPNYSEEIRNLVLNRLDKVERKKYVKALYEYQKQNPKSIIKDKVNDVILSNTSISSARKISRA